MLELVVVQELVQFLLEQHKWLKWCNGVLGTSGTTGTSGSSGLTGTSGVNGTSGLTGTLVYLEQVVSGHKVWYQGHVVTTGQVLLSKWNQWHIWH
jgi:hypothetical protein